VVAHKRLILPQLGASGVNGLKVKRGTGFGVEFGPVRAEDIPAYMKTRTATKEMRQVRFDFKDRLVLVPVEIVHSFLPILLAGLILYFAAGLIPTLAVITAVLAGAVLFPLLLPLLPTRDFSSKGFILGGLVTLPFIAHILTTSSDRAIWVNIMGALALGLVLLPVTAYLVLNFTGATTFTSKSGVKREMAAYIPIMAWTFGVGLLLMILYAIFTHF
jgi:hypothetical protein